MDDTRLTFRSVTDRMPCGWRSRAASTARIALLTCWGLNTAALADDIYKWKDQDGVHFGSRPPPGGGEIVKMGPAGMPSGDLQERKERTQRLLDAYADERREQSEARQKKEAERKERQRHCRDSKARQLEYASAGFIYVPDAQGNRRIVGDAERAQMQAEADSEVAKWCR